MIGLSDGAGTAQHGYRVPHVAESNCAEPHGSVWDQAPRPVAYPLLGPFLQQPRTMKPTTRAIQPFFCFGLLALSPLASHAQGPHFGIKGGLNMSNLYSTEVDDRNSRIGFNGGVFGRTTLDKSFGLQAELLYSTKGNKTHYEGFFGLVDQDVKFNLNYLELPVMAAFRFADNAVELQIGGYAAYLLSSDVITDGDLGSGSDEIDSDKLKKADVGLVGGVAFNAGPAQLGARYEYGLSSISDSDEAEFLLGDAKNSCFQVYIALGMPGGKE